MNFKMIVITTATMISSAAFSTTSRDSWPSIRNNKNVLILQPGIAMSMGSTGVFNTCATDEDLKSINPIKTCTTYKKIVHGVPNSEAGGWVEYVCINYRLREVVLARDHEEKICSKYSPVSEASSGECIKWETISRTYSRNFKLEVVSGLGENYMQHLFDKSFSAPDCE
jgi:hypothetical protein